MIYLIKFIFFLLISNNILANENKINEILFKINNKVFTNVDLQKRIKYVELINNLKNVYKFMGKAFHDETLVAESEFSAMITSK